MKIANKSLLKFLLFTCIVFFAQITFGQLPISPNNYSGLKLWFCGDSCKLNVTLNVDTIIDLSGHANHGTQNSGPYKPLISNNLLNGHKTILFDGIDDFISFNPLNDIRTIFWVVKKNSASINLSPLLGHSSLFDFHRGLNGELFSLGLTNSLITDGQTKLNFNVINGSVTSFNNSFNIVSVKTTGFVSAEYFNRDRTNVNRVWDGELAELIIYNQPLSSAEIIEIETYLINKYSETVSITTDTTNLNTFCPYVISTTGNFTNFLWSSGATSSAITVNESGKYWVTATNDFGIVSSDTIVVNYPNINSERDTSFCFGNNLLWNPQLSQSDFTFLWQDNSTNSTFNINQSGDYFVKITDSFGCSANSDTVTIIIDNFPTIADLGPDTSLCAGNSITLINGNQAGVNYLWNDNSTNSTLVISSSGEYYLTATNSNNCVAKDTINVTIVGQAPLAGFQNTLTCENSSINFTDTSIALGGATITNWFWNFGDASASNDTSIVSQPNYTFSDTGSYTINLTVTTNAGCKQNLTKNIFIYPKPIVDFTNVIACQNDSAFFNDAINPLGYPITNYQWNFGDALSGASNTDTNSDPFHIFSQNANYQVQLIATNNQGCIDSITKPITVRDEVSADFNYTSACINIPISFTDNSIAPSPNNSNTRNWSFFPGTATGLTATRTYSTAGTRNVMLKVTGFNGCISSITKQIQVSLPPDADFNSSIICVGDSFQLTDVSLPINGNINSWQWKDASTMFSNTQNPKYILNTVGNKNIFLQVTNDAGCIDTITKSVFANPLPDASFDIGPTIYLFTDSPITFTPALSSATNYFWTFSDGNSYSDPSLSLPFTNEGSYNVNLAITNNLGCKNNSLQPFTVARRNTDLGIIAARSAIDNDGFVGVEADLFNYGSSPITSFEILYELTGGGIMKETWAVDTLPPAAVLLFKFSSKSFLNVNERENAISCIKILTVNNVIDDNISNNENCAALNSNKQLVAEPFPNPADGDVTLPIVLTEDKTINVTIYDYLGKLIAENLAYEGVTGLNFIKIPSAEYSSGTYTLKISISDNNYIRKLIKQGSTK